MVVVAACLVGHLSELIGRKRTFLIVGVINLVLVPLCYWQFGQLDADSTGAVIFYALVLFFLGNAAFAPVLIFLNERFPTAIRASGTGLSWNVGFAIGGIMPTFVSLTSPSVEDIPSRLIYFMVGAILIYLVGAILVPETRGKLK